MMVVEMAQQAVAWKPEMWDWLVTSIRYFPAKDGFITRCFRVELGLVGPWTKDEENRVCLEFVVDSMDDVKKFQQKPRGTLFDMDLDRCPWGVLLVWDEQELSGVGV